MSDPEQFLHRFPDRPLNPSEANRISEDLNASVLTITHKDSNGEKYIPVVHLFIPEKTENRGCAIMFWMDEELTEWKTSMLSEGITQSDWLDGMQLMSNDLVRKWKAG